MKFVARLLLAVVSFSFLSNAVRAEDTLKMYYKNEEILKVIEVYSKASGQKFIIDPSVRGKISIFQQEEISLSEAFNQLSTALAVNGFAISKQGDTMVIASARNIQRSLLEVTTQVPSLKPERMVTWIVTLKNATASELHSNVRTLSSRDGEINTYQRLNQLYITDWASNLNRIAALVAELDKRQDPTAPKYIPKQNSQNDSSKKSNKLEGPKPPTPPTPPE